MTDAEPRRLLAHPIVPVANEEDATATASVAVPHLAAAGGTARVVYVVEKAGGGIDKASVEQREQAAQTAFDAFETVADAAGVAVDTDILYGTDIVKTILDDAAEIDATAVIFSPRGEPGKRSFMDWLTGDVRDRLVTESERPVVVLPVEHNPKGKIDEQATDAGESGSGDDQ